jgi:RING-variant domain
MCAGTMKYIHLFCLQKWLAVKLNFEKNNGVISILWESLICELCSSVFPLTVNYHDKTYNILDFNINEMNKLSPLSSRNSQNLNSGTESNFLLIKSFSKEGNPLGLHYVEFSDDFNKNEIILVTKYRNFSKKKKFSAVF